MDIHAAVVVDVRPHSTTNEPEPESENDLAQGAETTVAESNEYSWNEYTRGHTRRVAACSLEATDAGGQTTSCYYYYCHTSARRAETSTMATWLDSRAGCRSDNPIVAAVHANRRVAVVVVEDEVAGSERMHCYSMAK